MRRAKVPRHERAHHRAKVGPLRAALVKDKTAAVYKFSVNMFFLWIGAMSYAWPSDGDDLDALVSEFGEAA